MARGWTAGFWRIRTGQSTLSGWLYMELSCSGTAQNQSSTRNKHSAVSPRCPRSGSTVLTFCRQTQGGKGRDGGGKECFPHTALHAPDGHPLHGGSRHPVLCHEPHGYRGMERGSRELECPDGGHDRELGVFDTSESPQLSFGLLMFRHLAGALNFFTALGGGLLRWQHFWEEFACWFTDSDLILAMRGKAVYGFDSVVQGPARPATCQCLQLLW